ncbi:MAG TPA: hypothetical protein VEY07_07355 [Thermoplasmata archaeon]|nr:hypothetical protein [Thermoplasmata archaeon]
MSVPAQLGQGMLKAAVVVATGPPSPASWEVASSEGDSPLATRASEAKTISS